MSNDLISRSALMKEFEERMKDDNAMCPVIKVLDVLEIIDEQPTAYDVDKVEECIVDMSGIQFDGNNESYQLDWCIATKRAIDIVKSGGVA